MKSEIIKKNIVALNWFIDHKGYIMQLPKPVNTSEGEIRIHSQAKGIYKPKWSDFALSIKIVIGSPYSDDLKESENDKWILNYNEEENPQHKGRNEDLWTNESLIKNMEQGLPVGILYQTNEKPALYKIFGLGKVTEYKNGKFKIESL